MNDSGAADELAYALRVAHEVAVLAETDPLAPLVIAVRVALDVADARRANRRTRRLAALDVHGGDAAGWAGGVERWRTDNER